MKLFRWTRMPAGLTLLSVLVAFCTTAPSAEAAGPARASSRPVVTTTTGPLAGRVHDRAEEFLGVPYAAPPVGERRLRPPRRPESWKGVRDAVVQAPACVQFAPLGLLDPSAVSEDCLYLDVYRPRGARPGDRLPVMFWMHGGAYVVGTGTQFGGRTMADLTHSVVVSVNYRLGQLGYLAVPELARQNPLASGSFGLMDQIAALRWTRENIAGFGGDPGNVTIWGQSAGSGSACAMLASPQAAGLFSRAILQSGPCSLLRTPDVRDASAADRAFAAAAGCPDPATSADCLRHTPVAELVAAARTHPTAGPAHGDKLLPAQPWEAITSGTWNRVPVLIGSTRAEARFFVGLSRPNLTAQEYVDHLTSTYGAVTPQVLDRYPLGDYASPYLALSAVLTDSTFACHSHWATRVFAGQVPTYAYEFDDPYSPTLAGAQVPGLDVSNAHSAELAYLHDFTMGDRPLTAAQQGLGDAMKRYWAAFARAADPGAAEQTPWLTAGPAGAVLTLTPGNIRMSDRFSDAHQCAFWSTMSPPAFPALHVG